MDDNRLTVLPFQMHTLDVLESFSMTGNDIKNPPLNYDKEGFPTLRRYWKRIEASQKTGILELVDMTLLMFPPELALDVRYAYTLRYLDLSGVCVPFVCERDSEGDSVCVCGNSHLDADFSVDFFAIADGNIIACMLCRWMLVCWWWHIFMHACVHTVHRATHSCSIFTRTRPTREPNPGAASSYGQHDGA